VVISELGVPLTRVMDVVLRERLWPTLKQLTLQYTEIESESLIYVLHTHYRTLRSTPLDSLEMSEVHCAVEVLYTIATRSPSFEKCHAADFSVGYCGDEDAEPLDLHEIQRRDELTELYDAEMYDFETDLEYEYGIWDVARKESMDR
jgi:hypothetical protein